MKQSVGIMVILVEAFLVKFKIRRLWWTQIKQTFRAQVLWQEQLRQEKYSVLFKNQSFRNGCLKCSAHKLEEAIIKVIEWTSAIYKIILNPKKSHQKWLSNHIFPPLESHKLHWHYKQHESRRIESQLGKILTT